VFCFSPTKFVHIEIDPCNNHFSPYFEGLKPNILYIIGINSNMNKFWRD